MDQGSLTMDRTQEAMNQVTGRMLDAQMGRISWSLWSEKSFPEDDRLVWCPSTEQLRRWKTKVEYTYASFGEEVAGILFGCCSHLRPLSLPNGAIGLKSTGTVKLWPIPTISFP